MLSGLTIFSTYVFETATYSSSVSYGYSKAIHSNYIQTITTDSLDGKTLSLFFDSVNDFPFMAGSGSTSATGFTATGFTAIVQVVSGISTNDLEIKPDPAQWRQYDLTSQIKNHTIGDRIDPNNLANSIFIIDFIDQGLPYDLSYLDYPTSLDVDNLNMGFGEEAFFFGTVKTDISANVYTTDIPVVMPLNQFNSTTNPTWNGNEPVQITEIGLYDENNNLVGIGKLNYPIEKNNTIARTIQFAIDF